MSAISPSGAAIPPCLRMSVATSKANKSADFWHDGLWGYQLSLHVCKAPYPTISRCMTFTNLQLQTTTTKNHTTTTRVFVCVCVLPSLQRSASQLYQPRVPGVQFRILQVSIKTDPTETPAHGNLNLTKSFY